MGIKSKILNLTGFMAVMAVIASLIGCTRNNGEIGNWFGTWQLLEITADGEREEGYKENIFWKFQNDVISMARVSTDNGANTRDQVWGTWSEENDDTLLLDFTHADDIYPADKGEAGIGIYVPFAETHLQYGRVSVLHVMERKGDMIRLRYVGSDGVTYEYHLKKQ